MKKILLATVLLAIGLMVNSPDIYAQAKKPQTYKGEITNLDAFNSDIRTKGVEVTLFGIYLQRVKTQLADFEQNYAKLEYSPDSVQSIINEVIRSNKNEVQANAIDLSQGMAFNIKKFSQASGSFNGKLSPAVEKQVFDLQWTSKNKAPLKTLKAQTPDFGPELEQILVNEANTNALVEALLRNIIFDRVKIRISDGLVFTLSEKDALGVKLGKKLENYILANYKEVLAKKNIDELVSITEVVDKY
ncbi:hypothetical protein [Chloroherpeton thalassium]|nr:hypothetical protein [Chloroherpeton thalassium]